MKFNLFSFFIFILNYNLIYSLFSGFYYANKNEEYGGAFLIHKERFLNSTLKLDLSWYPEGVIFSVIQKNNLCLDSNIIFTRDYYDFLSDHLSTTTNIIGTMPLDTQINILNYYNSRFKNIIKNLKYYITNTTKRNKIISIIPYSEEIANPGGNDKKYIELHQQIRRNYFIVTFYSIYRYFTNIIVYVASQHDVDLLSSWNLPILKIINLDDTLSKVPKDKYFFVNPQHTEARPRNQLLPKYALLSASESLKSDPTWSQYQYLYYTEGDQMLHLRKIKLLLKAIDSRGGKDILVPHRMQVFNLFNIFHQFSNF